MTSLADGSTGRLGDFVRGAMADYNQTPHYTPSGMFNLMGDPALRLRTTPAGIAGSVKLDVNGNGVADAEDTNSMRKWRSRSIRTASHSSPR